MVEEIEQVGVKDQKGLRVLLGQKSDQDQSQQEVVNYWKNLKKRKMTGRQQWKEENLEKVMLKPSLSEISFLKIVYLHFTILISPNHILQLSNLRPKNIWNRTIPKQCSIPKIAKHNNPKKNPIHSNKQDLVHKTFR